MTRIAAGHPGIWPDICVENRVAIVAELDELISALSEMREVVDKGDRGALMSSLERAREARVNLPSRFGPIDALAEIRVPVPDDKGELARITTLATDLDVSIADLEIAHSAEGQEGVVIILVEAVVAQAFVDGLVDAGFRPSLRTLQ
jgi:prephenate dehydrogenase